MIDQRVTKVLRGFSCAHRMWAADSHCRFIHGYDRTFELVITGQPDPTTGFVFDFGAFGPIKAALEAQFDHTLCVADNDPALPHLQALHDAGVVDLRPMTHPGMEGAAMWALSNLAPMVRSLSNSRARLVEVTVHENEKNSSTVRAA